MDQEAQVETVLHLIAVSRRRLYAKLGYSSIFTYAVEALGFSEPAAAQRVHAMRLTQAVPVAEEKLKSGELSLSSAASVQRFIRKEEKVSQRVLDPQEKEKIISEVSGKSARETERILLRFASDPEPHLFKEKSVPLTATRTQLTFLADEALMADVERIRELKGNLSLEEIFKSALSLQLDRIDPARKVSKIQSEQSTHTSDENPKAVEQKLEAPIQDKRPVTGPFSPAAPASRYIPASLLRALYQRSGGRSEYTDQKPGKRCGSRFRLEVEHQARYCGKSAICFTLL